MLPDTFEQIRKDCSKVFCFTTPPLWINVRVDIRFWSFKSNRNSNENENKNATGEDTYAGALRAPRAGSPACVFVFVFVWISVWFKWPKTYIHKRLSTTVAYWNTWLLELSTCFIRTTHVGWRARTVYWAPAIGIFLSCYCSLASFQRVFLRLRTFRFFESIVKVLNYQLILKAML